MSLMFFFNDTATTEIYTLSLHDALPICHRFVCGGGPGIGAAGAAGQPRQSQRSEEHTSELQSLTNLVCRLLLEKKNFFCADEPHERALRRPHQRSISL